MKKAIKIALSIIIILTIIVLSYVAYVFIDYKRLDDNLELDVTNPNGILTAVPVDTELSITSWNIGFAAYTADYSFFMDGGEYSRGLSEEIVENTANQIATDLKSFDSDFYFVQEVDIDGTRSYHINEYDIITQPFANKSKVFAQNYDSPYLLYPILEPHGKNQSGLATMSNYKIVSSLRRSLPIQGGFSKLVDLDRCYNISRVSTANGKELVLINVHLSAYTTDPTIADQQLAMLYADMQAEYDKGNYVICGGDFNKDLLGDSASIFGISGSDYSWAQSFPFNYLPDGFTLVAPYDESNPIPSCRNADIPWDPETTFQITVDGFIISNNVECIDSNVVDLQFENSDHNPVYMNFKLIK